MPRPRVPWSTVACKMFALDLRTVILGFAISSAICMAVMVSLWRSQATRSTAFALLAGWATAEFCGLVLFALRGSVPDLLSIVLAQACIMGGYHLLLIGLEHYLDKRGPQAHNHALLVAFVVIDWYFLALQPSVSARYLNIAVFLTSICAQIAWLSLRRVDPSMRRATALCGTIMLVACVFSTASIAVELHGPSRSEMFMGGAPGTAVILAFQMVGIAMTFSLFWMINGRQQILLQDDISALKVSERAIRLSEARLRRAEVEARMGHWELHMDTLTMMGSEGASRIYGVDANRLDYEITKAIPLAEERPRLDAAVARLVADGTPYDLDFKIRAVNTGEIRLVHSRASFDREQRTVFGVIQDITERRKIEERLQLAASVFTHAGEGIAIVDATGLIVEVNAAFVRITGYGPHEVQGQSPSVLKSGRHTPEFYREMWRALGEKKLWSGEIWNRRKNGELYAQILTISRVDDEAGQVRNYVALFSDITLMKQHELQLEHNAHHDMLTGLPNRMLLADRLRQALAHSQRSHRALAVVYLDLDGFKAVNDRYGHHTGDELLIAVSRRLKSGLRGGDTLARVGGDEFVALLLDLEGRGEYTPLLTRMLKSAAEPFVLGDTVLQVSASIGVALYPEDGDMADQLLHRADLAMYQAKRTHPNSFQFFDSTCGEFAQEGT